MKYFIYGVVGIVATAVVTGFFLVGSPKEERARQFDARRVNDLRSLQYEVVNYWQTKGKLPASLDTLSDLVRGVVRYADPETGVPYEYAAKGDLTFELCAIFSSTSTATAAEGYPIKPYPAGTYNEEWTHGAGHTCFTRTIDTDLYPPIKK